MVFSGCGSAADPGLFLGRLRSRQTVMGLRLRLILILAVPLVLVVGVYGIFRIRQEQAQGGYLVVRLG